MLKHVAIIMDGNGRWAEARGLPRAAGHRQGIAAVRRVVYAAREREIPYLTLFGFSEENWRRPGAEVQTIFALLELFLARETAELANQGIRLRVIGDTERLPARCQALLNEARQQTRSGRRLTLTLALSYGGRGEIAAACRRLLARVATGELSAADVTPERLASCLDTAGLPDPDLVIRTAGEQRLSNFMLWQMAYAELYFSPVAWPDFGPEHLAKALTDYHGRRRTYGALPAALTC